MDTFSTKSLALQAQKKLLSKMASRTVASAFIDDTSSEVLDELYRATKEFTRSRKEAQKLVKNLVKVAVKLGVLLRAGQLGAEELARITARDPDMAEAFRTRWIPMEEQYFAAFDIQRRADLVVRT